MGVTAVLAWRWFWPAPRWAWCWRGAALAWRRAALPIVAFADILRALPPLVISSSCSSASRARPAAVGVRRHLAVAVAGAGRLCGRKHLGRHFAVPHGQLGGRALHRHALVAGHALGGAAAGLRIAVPPLTNRVISITKNTALGSVVALNEILNISQSASSNAGNPTPLVLGAAAYLVLFLPVVLFARWLETRWQWKR
jgi:polar amino acid transport system permease protein